MLYKPPFIINAVKGLLKSYILQYKNKASQLKMGMAHAYQACIKTLARFQCLAQINEVLLTCHKVVSYDITMCWQIQHNIDNNLDVLYDRYFMDSYWSLVYKQL